MMRKLFSVAALAVIVLGAVVQPAQAQRAKQLGLVAGVDFTTINGCSATDNNCFISEGSSSKTGFVGGLFVGIPVGGGNTWIEPELLYIQKGDKYDNSVYTGTESFDYISIPVLFRWNSQPTGGFFFLIGPVVNFNVSCSDSGTYNPTGDTYDDKCSDIPGVTANTTIGGMVGIGYAKGHLGIEGRWMNDWGNVISYKDPTTDQDVTIDGRNQGWTIMARLTK
jgi:hypothetical protein